MDVNQLIENENYIVPHWYMYPTKGMYVNSQNNRDLLNNEFQDLSGKINIYIHIPFCNMKCSFCTLYTTNRNNESTIEIYLRYLKKELDLILSKVETSRIRVNNIYIGGGTPSLLSFSQLEKLIGQVYKYFNLTKDITISGEFSPDTVKSDTSQEWFKLGFTRVSIGVQSFNDVFLNQMNRKHDGITSLRAIGLLKESGFKNINIDLIYGHKKQSSDQLILDISKGLKSNVNSITLHPLANRRRTGYLNDPNNSFEYNITGYKKLFSDAIDFLNTNNWHSTNAIAFSNTQTGLSIENSEAKGIPTIGIGAGSRTYLESIHKSSISYNTKSTYFGNLDSYFSQIDKGLLPIQSQVVLSEEEKIRRRLVLGIVADGVPELFLNRTTIKDKTLYLKVKNEFDFLISKGMVKKINSSFRLSKLGLLEASSVGTILSSDDMKNLLGYSH